MLFEKGDYGGAIDEYNDALAVLPPRPQAATGSSSSDADGEGQEAEAEAEAKGEDGDGDGEDGEVRLLRAVVYSNIAACHLKKREFKEAVVACNESLLDDVLYLKSLNRRAQANEEIGSWSSLTSSLEGEQSGLRAEWLAHTHAHALFCVDLTDYRTMNGMPHPASLQPSLDAALARIPPKIASTSEREKEEMIGKLKGVGDSVLGYFGLSTNNFQFKKGEGGGYNLNFVK